MLAPIDLINISKEQIAICAFCKIPLIEPEIVVRFDKEMRRPLANMRVRLGAIAKAVLGVALGTFTIAWPETLPAPTVRKIDFGKGHLQHDGVRKARQPFLAIRFLGGAVLKRIVFAGEVFFNAGWFDRSKGHRRFPRKARG